MALSFTMLTAAAEPGSATLDVAVSGLRSVRGDVLVCLTANPKAFPDCSKDANARKLKVAAASANDIRIEGVAPGAYAISLIHDENGNGRMDTRFMMPREGFGFSRDARVSFGPPKFSAAEFRVGIGASSQRVTVRYML